MLMPLKNTQIEQANSAMKYCTGLANWRLEAPPNYSMNSRLVLMPTTGVSLLVKFWGRIKCGAAMSSLMAVNLCRVVCRREEGTS